MVTRSAPGASGEPAELDEPWRDQSLPAEARVADLLSRLTLAEKVAQLGSVWLGATADGDPVAPGQDLITDFRPVADIIEHGIGHLTRVYGTRPVTSAVGARALAGLQRQVMAANRFGIPAIAHEECLTGLGAYGATIFPAPPAWGATFDPGLVGEMAAAIGASMRAVGVHQGLAPVLDVARDARWGRLEETIGEDPYLVGTLGTAYVRGLQSAGVHATLKHFAGYPASKAGRNQAPVSVGPRELADTILPPFEMAIRLGNARSVMPSYTAQDGVPASADTELLTTLLRDQLGFDGVVVSDYFAIGFLELQHHLAADPVGAAALALAAGMDVELPGIRCYGPPLAAAVESGRVPETLIDRAVARVLTQKCALGLLDPDFTPEAADAGEVDLDPPEHRAIARRLASESLVLLTNTGRVLPLRPDARVAVIGPLADDPLAFFGCYSMPRHLGPSYPEAADSVPVVTVLDALRDRFPVEGYAAGCAVTGADRSGFAEAVALASAADIAVAVVGDVSGLFGRGTSGEGCDITQLTLPGVQEELLLELASTGTPVVAVLVTGRPYALSEVAARTAALVQAFFPGEEGGVAIASMLAGETEPSGRLPVELPADPAGQPAGYLRTPVAAAHSGSVVDPTPLFAFGHGLSYTTFEYQDLTVSPAEIRTDGTADITVTIRNTGDRPGTEVVQLYLSDPLAQVTRPVRWLAGFTRVPLGPGEARQVTFQLHADRTAFTGLAGHRIVEPGEIGVAVGGASDRLPLEATLLLTGPERRVSEDRVLYTPVTVG